MSAVRATAGAPLASLASRMWLTRARAPLLAFAIVGLVGLGLRVDAARTWNHSRPDSAARLFGDERGYDQLARELLAGKGLTWPGRVPLYPLWLAAVYRATHFSYSRTVYVQVLPGLAAVFLTFALGALGFGWTVGAVAALGAAIDVVLVFHPVRLQSEVLFTPVVLIIAIVLMRTFERVSVRTGGWAGVWIGIANLIRPTLVLFPLFAAGWMLWRNPSRPALRAATTLVVASTLVVAPWLVRNYVRYHAVYPLATSNAILWQGSPEYFHLIRDRGYTYLDVWNKVIYGPEGEGHDPGSIEGDRYWTRRALHSIAREPFVYLRFCAEKAITFWIGDPNADWNDSYLFNYHGLRAWGFSRTLTAEYLASRALPIVAFLALFWIKGAWHRLSAVLCLLTYATLLHALLHAEARLSEPFHPLVWIVAAVAVCRPIIRRTSS